MKFAHIADCHLGGWRDPKLRSLTDKAFRTAVKEIISENVDFLLIAGDLFHTALPSFDSMRVAVQQLKKLDTAGINVYVIPGSHDYSPSGKTMIDVFEDAGLLVNVFKGKIADGKLRLQFTVDPKTGAKVTGIPGKRGMLDKLHYSSLDKDSLEGEEGYRIFMVHTAIRELMGVSFDGIDAMDISMLPKGLDYYAGGHLHVVETYSSSDYPLAVYPGPLFPNSFKELELLEHGTYTIVEDGNARSVPVKIMDTHGVTLDCSGMSPSAAEEELRGTVKGISSGIVMIRLFGTLVSGRPSDIDLKGIIRDLYSAGAYFVMRNVTKLTTEEFEEATMDKRSVPEIEEGFLAEVFKDGSEQANKMMNVLGSEKGEGEKVHDYERRILEEAKRLLDF
jgi:exonuclease SbcD